MSCAHKCPYTNENCIHPLPFCEEYKDKFPTYESFKCKLEVYIKKSKTSKMDYLGAKRSNADRIRAMSDEELAEFLVEHHRHPCKYCISCWTETESVGGCREELMRWLKSEVKE